MEAYQPWLTIDVISIPGPTHPLSKKPQKFLPKYDPDEDISPEHHIKQFMDALKLMNGNMRMLFVDCFHTHFKGKLQNGSLTSLQDLSLLGINLKRHLWQNLV